MVRRILGTGGGSSVNKVGNLTDREVGVKSRFVLVVEGAVEDARGRCPVDLGALSSSSSSSESESSILSASSSCASSSRGS